MPEQKITTRWHFWLLLVVVLVYVAIIVTGIPEPGVPYLDDSALYLYMVLLVVFYLLTLGLTSYLFGYRLGMVSAAILGWLAIIQTAVNPLFQEHILVSILLTAIGVFVSWIGMYTDKMKTQITDAAESIERLKEEIKASMAENERISRELHTSEEKLRSAQALQEGVARYPKFLSSEKGYELGVDLFFNASHNVRTNGKPGPTHPHSWRIQARFTGDTTDKNGILVGFAEAKEIVQQRVFHFNGQLLNEIAPFDRIQPTSENLASFLYRDIKNEIDSLPLKLQSVSIWESPTNFVTYSENGHAESSTPTG
jgi:6-pyruvoyltetrahydropterin/6-carboxytetrahydropterin synthase